MTTASMRTGAVLSVALVAALIPGLARGARMADCTPAQRDGAISAISLDETRVAAFDEVQAYFQGRLPADACAGDTVVVRIPVPLRVQPGTFTIGDPDGVPIGTMAVSPARHTAVLTFNDYVSSHEQVGFYGYLSAVVSPSLDPASRHDLRWAVGAGSFSTPVSTVACPRCDRPRTRPRMRATLEGNVATFALESRPTRRRGEKVVFIDRVAPGQAVRCRALRGHRAHVGKWGQLVYDGVVRLRVTTCGKDPGRPGGTLIRASVTSRAAHQHLVLAGSAVVRDPAVTRHTDVGVVLQRGGRGQVSASATRSTVGSGVGSTGPIPALPPTTATPGAGTSPSGTPPDGGDSRADGERAEAASGPDRTPILLSGLGTFLLGALVVTVGLRRRR